MPVKPWRLFGVALAAALVSILAMGCEPELDLDRLVWSEEQLAATRAQDPYRLSSGWDEPALLPTATRRPRAPLSLPMVVKVGSGEVLADCNPLAVDWVTAIRDCVGYRS